MIEDPPPGYDRPYFQRLVNQLKEAFSRKDILQANTTIPAKPIEGKLYYFPNTITPTITTAGVWVYKSTGWVLLG